MSKNRMVTLRDLFNGSSHAPTNTYVYVDTGDGNGETRMKVVKKCGSEARLQVAVSGRSPDRHSLSLDSQVRMT